MPNLTNIKPLVNDLAKSEHENNIACQACSLYHLCLPLGLHNQDLAKLDKIIQRNYHLSKGELLFDSEMSFKSVYVVRSGSFKTTLATADGRQQVTGFYFPGEFIGMDAIYQQRYQSDAKALESSTVCQVPFEKLQELSASIPSLQTKMLSRLSQELSSDKNLMFLLGKKTADEKLATFLLSLSRRFHERGYSAQYFQLTMSRGDIANHLGLAVETVSRIFSRFQAQGLMDIDNKALVIRDHKALEVLCG